MSSTGLRLAARTLALALALAGCAAEEREPPEPARRILLVTFDTTRADRIGAYGHGEAETPTLDRLAREGVLFENAYAAAPVTLPSHATILTGVTPPAHGARDNALFALGPQAQLLPEVLRERGWRTGAFVGAWVLDPVFGLDQGFETYEAVVPSGGGADGLHARPADAVAGDAIAWLDTLAPGESFFAWVHFYDPHAAYDPPEPWRRRLADPYDGEIAFCDAQLDRLLGHLRRRGLDAGLLVAVTADHGEMLGEHGEETHGVFVYEAAIRVPLILSGAPLAARAGERIERTVSLASLAPTLLLLAGVPRTALPHARAPSLLENGAGGPAVYFETLMAFHSFRWHPYRGIVSGAHKLIEGPGWELYETASDPGEHHDLSSERPELLARLRGELERELAERQAPLGWASDRDLLEGDAALLAALGYVAGSTGGDPFAAELPDAHGHIGDVEVLSEANDLIAEAAGTASRFRASALLERARGLLRGLLERNPGNEEARLRLALTESHLGNHEVAVPLLEEALRRSPLVPETRLALANSYRDVGREEDAVRILQEGIALSPSDSRAYLWLVDFYRSGGDNARAAGWLEQYLRVVGRDTQRGRAVAALFPELSDETSQVDRRPGGPGDGAP